jgi:hypothetical protein
MRPGDHVWYKGSRHAIQAVSVTGGFGLRPHGICPPYYGLAGIDTTVKIHGVGKPGAYYTFDGDVRIGWVSWAVCRTDTPAIQEDIDVQRADLVLEWRRRPR